VPEPNLAESIIISAYAQVVKAAWRMRPKRVQSNLRTPRLGARQLLTLPKAAGVKAQSLASSLTEPCAALQCLGECIRSALLLSRTA